MDYVQRHESRPAQNGRHLILQLLDVVLWLDERKISHNDLKTEHVFYRRDGQLVIIHYGLAQRNDLRYENRKSSVQKLYKRAEFGELSYPTGSLIARGSLCFLGEPSHSLEGWNSWIQAKGSCRRPRSGVLRQG